MKKRIHSSCISRRTFLGTATFALANLVFAQNPQTNLAEDGVEVSGCSGKLGYRYIGKLKVSSIGLGVQNITRKYDGTLPYKPEMINLIQSSYDNGVTFFDAAEAYGPFDVERVLGEAIAPFKNNVVIATKFGWNIDLKSGKWLGGLNSNPSHIKKAVEGMLQRLKRDYIDLLYQHRVDPRIPIEDVAGVVKDLIKEGKVLHWGLSEMGVETLRRAHQEAPLCAIQNEYSLLWRDVKNEIFNLCEELGIGFVPWSPLGVQFLTGWIDEKTQFAPNDFRSRETRFSPQNLAKNMPLISLIKEWSAKKNCAPSQIALAWLLRQKPYIVPIPGTTNKEHMLENIGAIDVVFTQEEFLAFNHSLEQIRIYGKRLPDDIEALSNVEAPPKVNR